VKRFGGLVIILLIVVGCVWYAATHFPSGSAPAAGQAPAAAPPILTLGPLGPPCGDACGKERWAVKTLSDADRDAVDFHPVDATIEQLIALPRPEHRPDHHRVGPAELTTYTVIACLGIYDTIPENDGDIHLVLGHIDQRISLITEIPNPRCSGVCSSGVTEVFAAARDSIRTILESGQVSPECNNDVPLLAVTGVGFFDHLHNQNGVAPNGIELHPILLIARAAGHQYVAGQPHAAEPPRHHGGGRHRRRTR